MPPIRNRVNVDTEGRVKSGSHAATQPPSQPYPSRWCDLHSPKAAGDHDLVADREATPAFGYSKDQWQSQHDERCRAAVVVVPKRARSANRPDAWPQVGRIGIIRVQGDKAHQCMPKAVPLWNAHKPKQPHNQARRHGS